MAVQVVDQFEAVEAEHDQRQRPPMTVGASELLVQVLLEGAMVQQAGQPVGGRFALQGRERVGLRERDRDQCRKALQHRFGGWREAIRVRFGDGDVPPRPTTQTYRSGDRAAVAGRGRGRGALVRGPGNSGRIVGAHVEIIGGVGT